MTITYALIQTVEKIAEKTDKVQIIFSLTATLRFDGALNVDVTDPRTCIHLGQEGIQVSNACWELFGLEHDIQPRGGIMTFVSTAPVDEPTAMSFTIPLTGSTTVTTAAVVST